MPPHIVDRQPVHHDPRMPPGPVPAVHASTRNLARTGFSRARLYGHRSSVTTLRLMVSPGDGVAAISVAAGGVTGSAPIGRRNDHVHGWQHPAIHAVLRGLVGELGGAGGGDMGPRGVLR